MAAPAILAAFLQAYDQAAGNYAQQERQKALMDSRAQELALQRDYETQDASATAAMLAPMMARVQPDDGSMGPPAPDATRIPQIAQSLQGVPPSIQMQAMRGMQDMQEQQFRQKLEQERQLRRDAAFDAGSRIISESGDDPAINEQVRAYLGLLNEGVSVSPSIFPALRGLNQTHQPGVGDANNATAVIDADIRAIDQLINSQQNYGGIEDEVPYTLVTSQGPMELTGSQIKALRFNLVNQAAQVFQGVRGGVTTTGATGIKGAVNNGNSGIAQPDFSAFKAQMAPSGAIDNESSPLSRAEQDIMLATAAQQLKQKLGRVPTRDEIKQLAEMLAAQKLGQGGPQQ